MKQTLAALALLALAATAQALEYTRVVPEQSRLAFVSRQMGVPVEGEFRRFGVQLQFDPARPGAARASLEIDLTSIDAGSREANEEVVGKNWLDVKRYPVARFEAASIKALGNNRFELRGRMHLKGRSAELVLPVSFSPAGNTGILTGAFTLKRLQWGIGEGPWGDPGTVADEVEIKFRFLAEAAPAAKPARKP
jgi:polyisoprenoid-binding protein YceI